MHAFDYLRASGLKQASDWLQQHPEARPLSGGMTLVPSLKHRLTQVSHLVDLSRLQELRGTVVESGALRIGAGMRHAEEANMQMAPMLLSFMSESRRLVNRRMKEELRLRLGHAQVIEGLKGE